jgi:hypothetical protein
MRIVWGMNEENGRILGYTIGDYWLLGLSCPLCGIFKTENPIIRSVIAHITVKGRYFSIHWDTWICAVHFVQKGHRIIGGNAEEQKQIEVITRICFAYLGQCVPVNRNPEHIITYTET